MQHLTLCRDEARYLHVQLLPNIIVSIHEHLMFPNQSHATPCVVKTCVMASRGVFARYLYWSLCAKTSVQSRPEREWRGQVPATSCKSVSGSTFPSLPGVCPFDGFIVSASSLCALCICQEAGLLPAAPAPSGPLMDRLRRSQKPSFGAKVYHGPAKALILTTVGAGQCSEPHLTVRPLSRATKTSKAQGWNRVNELLFSL